MVSNGELKWLNPGEWLNDQWTSQTKWLPLGDQQVAAIASSLPGGNGAIAPAITVHWQSVIMAIVDNSCSWFMTVINYSIHSWYKLLTISYYL